MSSAAERASAWIRRRPDWRRPLAIVLGLAVVAAFLALALPPIVGFAAFLFSGGVWRDLLGVALVSLLVGLALAVVVGSLDPAAEPSRVAPPGAERSRGPLWSLAGILIAVVPAACVLVALVASGALVDIIGWTGDRISEIRGAQSS